MSPEQARGRAREIDGRTDIWAAGATFFSLVTGQYVHAAAETSHELLIEAATVPARALGLVAPEVPAAIAAVVDRALLFQKEARWETAEAMRDALVKASQATVGPATPESVIALALRSRGGTPSGALASLHLPARTEQWTPDVLSAPGAVARSGRSVGGSTSAPMAKDKGPDGRRPILPWALAAGATVLGLLGAGVWLVKARVGAAPAHVAGASATAGTATSPTNAELGIIADAPSTAAPTPSSAPIASSASGSQALVADASSSVPIKPADATSVDATGAPDRARHPAPAPPAVRSPPLSPHPAPSAPSAAKPAASPSASPAPTSTYNPLDHL